MGVRVMTFWEYYKDQWKQMSEIWRMVLSNFSPRLLLCTLKTFSLLFNLQALYVMYLYDMKKMLPDDRYAKYWMRTK